ncbi:MAG: M20 family metallopeptidase [Candidatus Eremiobacteraeota bacterium]|nr:M20 family metallopeptidase [Candidatus Eremiobacteraeota bacterium]
MDIKDRIIQRVDSLSGEIVAVSRYIHRNPEEGYKEFKASKYLHEKLESQGFTVEHPMKSIPTALRAAPAGRRGKPAVGFMAEYDCLPGIGHGCGHNLIAASAFGAAAAMAPFLEETGGSVWFFGTPAEEYDGGKIPMLAEGVFAPIDVALEMHPECLWMVNTITLAMDALEIQFRGRAAHAACAPHEGVNALDAMITFFNAVNALRQQVKPDIRIHGIITHGGTYPNIIPDFTAARFYVRSMKRCDLGIVTEKMKNCARGAAKATGCRLKIKSFERSMDDMFNNPVVMGLLEENLGRLGVTDIAREDLEPGSTDFGNVSHVVPSVYMYAATAPPGKPLHTKEFARLSATEPAHESLILSVKAMALTACDLLTDGALLKRVQEAFVGRAQ